MISEDYVSFKIAKLLKEKGFDEPCQYFYKFDSNEIYRGTIFTNSQIGDKFYNAPTLQMAMKWLREVHNIDICVFPKRYDYILCGYNCQIYKNKEPLCYTGNFKIYEESCDTAIRYCLENLI